MFCHTKSSGFNLNLNIFLGLRNAEAEQKIRDGY